MWGGGDDHWNWMTTIVLEESTDEYANWGCTLVAADTGSGWPPLVLVPGCTLMGIWVMWSICDSGGSWSKAVRQGQVKKRKDRMYAPDMQNANYAKHDTHIQINIYWYKLIPHITSVAQHYECRTYTAPTHTTNIAQHSINALFIHNNYIRHLKT